MASLQEKMKGLLTKRTSVLYPENLYGHNTYGSLEKRSDERPSPLVFARREAAKQSHNMSAVHG